MTGPDGSGAPGHEGLRARASPAGRRRVLTVAEVDGAALRRLARSLGMVLVTVADDAAIPGSYWGEREAGLIGDRLFVRGDTPLHSLLHEAAHFACMDDARRRALDTDAGGDVDEECAVCALQVLLAGRLPGVGRERMLSDMDLWGYSFRLGSARRWWATDALEALAWLERRGLVAVTPGRPGVPATAGPVRRRSSGAPSGGAGPRCVPG